MAGPMHEHRQIDDAQRIGRDHSQPVAGGEPLQCATGGEHYLGAMLSRKIKEMFGLRHLAFGALSASRANLTFYAGICQRTIAGVGAERFVGDQNKGCSVGPCSASKTSR